MPATLIAPGIGSREHLRTFHLAGRGLEEQRPDQTLRPLLPEGLLHQLAPVESVYPVLITPGKSLQPLDDLAPHDVVRQVAAAMGDRAVVSASEMKEWVSAIPGEGWLAGFSLDSLVALHAACLKVARAEARSDFQLELKRCVTILQDLLSVDDSKRKPASAEAIGSALGASAAQFLSVSHLMGALSRRSGKAVVMDSERRRRCESTLATLEAALAETERRPAIWVFHWAGEPAGLNAFAAQSCRSGDPCAEALAFCDQQLRDAVPVLRALRVARLEANAAYDPAVHDEMLERFDWQTAEPGEIAALPVVVVSEPAERLARFSLTSLSRLLRSGRPVQILVPSAGLWTDDLSGSVADFGALALSHRGAFVLETCMAQWDHFSKGLTGMARTLHPAIAVVSVPAPDEATEAAWRENSLLSLSRGFPLFQYDPDRAGRWTDRFELVEPHFDRLAVVDAIAPSPRFREHFRLIPAAAWDDDQMEMHEYLDRYQDAPPLVVPFLNVTDETGAIQRVAVTRELAHLCFDRHRAWEMLTALAAKPISQVVAIEAVVDNAASLEAEKQAYLRVIALLADPQSLA